MELVIGSHVSFSKDKQLVGSVLESLEYKSNTFMFYTGAPQNTVRVPINNDLTQQALELMEKNNIDIKDVIVHAPYIINLANPKTHEFSVQFLKQELKRVEQLKATKLVLHPGSHVGCGVEDGIQNIIEGLNEVLTLDSKVTICIETMAEKEQR